MGREETPYLVIIIIIIIISLLNPLVVYNTKLQGRSRIRRTHNYTWQEGRSVLTRRNSEREKPDLNPYP